MAAIVIASVAAMPGNVMPVLAGLLSDFRSLDEVALGLLIASGTLAGLITSLTAPHWVGRVNLRYTIALALGAAALGLIGLRVAPGGVPLFLSQALAGAAAMVVACSCLTIIARLPNPTRAYSIKVTTDVVLAGTFLALVPASLLGLGGFVALIAAISVAAVALTPKLPARVAAAQRADGSPSRLRDAPAAAWLVLVTIVVFYIGGIGVWVFLERLAVQANIDRATASNAIAAGLFVGVIGSLGAAVLAGRTRRIWPETSSALVLVGSLIMLTYLQSAAQFYIAVFVFNASWNFFIPFVIGHLARSDTTGRLASLVPGTVATGGIVGPVLIGALIRSSGYTLAMLAMTLIVAASIAGYVALAKKG